MTALGLPAAPSPRSRQRGSPRGSHGAARVGFITAGSEVPGPCTHTSITFLLLSAR